MPLSATRVWAALDPHEIRAFGRVRSSLYSTRLAELVPGWQSRDPPRNVVERTSEAVRKWADVTTSRGLDWLQRHGQALKVQGGYVRGPLGSAAGGDPILSLIFDVEQQLRAVRIAWQNNPKFPDRRASPEFRKVWSALLLDLAQELAAVSRECRRRGRGASLTPP